MLAATTVVGIDVSRNWLDGFCLPGLQRFRLANSPEGHEELISMICRCPLQFMSGSKQQADRNGFFGLRLWKRGSKRDNSLRPRSRPLPCHEEHGPRQTGLMQNSLPVS